MHGNKDRVRKNTSQYNIVIVHRKYFVFECIFAVTARNEHFDAYKSVEGMTTLHLEFPDFVEGVALGGDFLYVITINSKDVHVYNATTLVPDRRIPIPDVHEPMDIAVSGNVLYVASHDSFQEHDTVFVIRLPSGKYEYHDIEPFPRIMSLSATKNGNVLISCFKTNLVEMSSKGHVVQKCDTAYLQPIHSLKLDKDTFLICHYAIGKAPVLFKMRRDSSDKCQSEAPRMALRRPVYLAVDRFGGVLVADSDRNVVLLMTSALEPVKEVIKASAGLNKPRRICLDEKRGRLYVVERGSKKVLIFDIRAGK